MRETLTLLAAVVEIIAPLPYIVNTLRGKTHPNIVTWFTWSLINGINAAAAFSVGSTQTGIYSLAGAFVTFSIVVLGIRHGVKKYTRFDAVCQLVALLGIPLWLLTHRPLLAVLLVLVVDFSGGLPTLRHAWRAPFEETMQTFVYSAVAGILLLASLREYSLVAITLPLYIFVFDSVLISIMVYRRRSV